MVVDKLTTNYYKVLALLFDKGVQVDGKRLVPITQSEVTKLTGINKTTVNKIFKELQHDGLITYESTRFGQYFITNRGADIVRKIKSIRDWGVNYNERK